MSSIDNILNEISSEDNIKAILKDFDKVSADVETAYNIFEKVYDTAFEKTYISDIVNGETINIKPENIIIENVDMEADKENFNKRCKACTKQLYDYQIKAIRQILQLENDGYYINPTTKDKIVSNSWILSLPIGSGKSLVFLFLALWYRKVPCHPIIISKSGRHIPIHEQLQFKYYPYYYEDCCYMEKLQEDGTYYSDENCVITYENYTQQPTTVILTHSHLLEQMRRYLMEDFPLFCKGKGTKINICQTAREIKTDDDIVIIPAYESNIKDLVNISHDKPFMRVIIDDYTSMPNIDNFRQILASSTIFVSGSGFERDPSRIPTSYYTLKYSLTPYISIVGRPEDTYKGVVRNNIAMIKLLGSSCDFSVYDFVQKVDELCLSLYNCYPKEIYPYLDSNDIKDYMGLYFILINKDKLRGAISAIDKDYNISGRYKNAKFIDKRSEIKYFIEWITKLTTIKDPKTGDAKATSNKLVADLLTPPSMVSTNNESTPIVQQECMCCHKSYSEHNGYGIVSTCCGAFYCENCIKNATTHKIADKITNDYYNDKHNCYCSCCRSKNPKIFINMSKKKDKSIYAFNIIDQYFKNSELNDVIKFDYYFYMLIHGLQPCFHEGHPININNEISRGIIDKEIFNKLHDETDKSKRKEIFEKSIQTKIKPIYSLDHLMIHSLESINKSLIAVNQTYNYTPYILFYNAPKYMENRIIGYMREFKKGYIKNGKKYENPISSIKPIFMNSIDGLIGIHLNVVAIVVFDFKDTTKDGVKQLLGRCLRINTFNNKITFFITPDVVSLV